MTAHTCTELTDGCYRCDLNRDEFKASQRDEYAELADTLHDLAERCYNGAGDPWQEFYDHGASPLLSRMADRLGALARQTPDAPASGAAADALGGPSQVASDEESGAAAAVAGTDDSTATTQEGGQPATSRPPVGISHEAGLRYWDAGWDAHQAFVAAQAVDQWAVRFGDGEIDAPYNSREHAQDVIDRAREQIALDARVADDYEPMALLRRTWTAHTTAWVAIS